MPFVGILCGLQIELRNIVTPMQSSSQHVRDGGARRRVYCFLIGCLIVRSIVLQRIIGAPMMLAGLVYAMLLRPPLLKPLQSYNLGPGALGDSR